MSEATQAETSGNSSDPHSLVQQPHGGSIRTGGKPGNRGGRPSSAIRSDLRVLFDDNRHILVEIAQKAKRDQDRVKALEVLAKYGLGKEIDTEDVKQRLRQTIDAIREVLPKEQADLVLKAIEPFWK